MNQSTDTSTHLEPRVVKLEAGLDILTKNVTDLSNAVRENATNLDDKLERLTVAVTQAQAPQKTDWSMIISAVFLVLAIGSAVFWPLNQVATNNKEEMKSLSEKFDEHNRLQLHTVGGPLIQRLEEQLKDHTVWGEKNHELLKSAMIMEINGVNKHLDEKLEAADLKEELHNSRNDARLSKLEQIEREQNSKDNDELRNWRLQAMQKSVNNLTPPTPITITK